MRDVILFGEDSAHESVLKAILQRISADYGVAVSVTVRSSIGGYGVALDEFAGLLREILLRNGPLPDLIILTTDSNCKGLTARLKDARKKVPPELEDRIVYAVPAPHIERWLLLDSEAFKAVLGRGCRAPDKKCKRDRYKQHLADAVRAAGLRPLLGGVEYAGDIIEQMDFNRAMAKDESFGHFMKDLRAAFVQWHREEGGESPPAI
jgi:hypothetical protein